jgi:glycosyltransferase involved in cell wall biosynthesis
MWSGQAMVLARILERFGPWEYLLVSYPTVSAASDAPVDPPRVTLPREPFEKRQLRGNLVDALGVGLRSVLRGWRIADQARRSGARALIATTGDLIDPPAAAVACAITRVPLVFYLFDDYLNQWGFEPGLQRWAAALERLVFAKADAVVVPNEALALELKGRRGVDAHIIRNPAVNAPLASPAVGRVSQASARIVYTGAIYHVNHSAFRTLIAALERIADRHITLDLYTAQDAGQLEKEGIRGEKVHIHPHIGPVEAAEVQRSSDILFMGFSFDSSVPRVIATSAPGKLGDYLASGRPILALVPANSFVGELLTRNDCGLVVSEDDPKRVAEAIVRLLDDGALVGRITANALALAREQFDPEIAARSLRGVLEGLI